MSEQREITADEAGGREGFSRRDVLKLGAASAVIAGTAAAGLRLAGAAEAGPKDPALTANRFMVDIPDCPVASANCIGVEIEDLTIDARETTTGLDVEYRTYAPGDALYGRVKVSFPRLPGDAISRELLGWLEDARTGKNIRKSISVICLKRDGAEARRFNLIDCFPEKYDPGDYSPSSNVATEKLTVKIGRIEFKT